MIRVERLPRRLNHSLDPRLAETGRFVGALVLAVLIYGVMLFIFGRDPVLAYQQIFRGALGDSYGWTEVLVKMTPFILTGLAAALPAQLGLINVGAEGQLYIGALVATGVALHLADQPAAVVIPLMIMAGFTGGGLWGGLSGVLRARAGLNETISSLLLNYVGIRVVDHFVHGPWKDPANFNWPYTAAFAESARLPSLFGSRVHLGLVLAIIAVIALWWLLSCTRWGFEMRVVGGNSEAARRSGLPINRYLILSMVIGGGLAGIAGMAETSAIQGRLQPGISDNYGYVGFLASWLAGAHPVRLVVRAALLAIIAVGGDVVQIGINLPAAAVNVLTALILLCVLGTRHPSRAS